MKRTLSRTFGYIAAVVILIGCVMNVQEIEGDEGTEKPAVQTVSLLTVGNSFAVNSTKFIKELAEADPRVEVILGKANLGGCTFERHWKHAAAYEQDPKSKEGKPYGGKSLRQILESRKWDIITIQQVSYKSEDYSTYQPYADNLAAYIRKYAPSADLRIHQIWAYRKDDPRFKGKKDYTQETMFERLTASYWKLAAHIHARIIPVGSAFQKARRHPDWNFTAPDPDYDYKNPRYPKLPDQTHSLNRGYSWAKPKGKNKKASLKMDGHHASIAGEYLGGAVFFECIFGKSVVGNTFVPGGMSKEDAAFLQKIAHETVEETEAVRTPPVPAKK